MRNPTVRSGCALAAVQTLFALCSPAAMRADLLPTGKAAPAFNLKDQDGRSRSLSDFGGRVVALTFYPADMTPGCTLEARALRDSMAELQRAGVQVLGISVQDVASKRAFCDKESLNYPLLADIGGAVAEQYGVKLPNGYARRVTYLVGGDGNIAAVLDSVDVKNHGRQVLEALQKIVSVTPAPPAGAAIGEPAPEFYLPGARDGKVVSLLGDDRQLATVVVFTSIRCPVSQAYEGRLKALDASYASREVRFVTVNANAAEMPADIAAHNDKRGLTYAVLKDAGAQVATMYRAHVTPEAYVIDARGIVRYHGRVDDSQNASEVRSHDLSDAIQAVLDGKGPKVAQAQAFGCKIKRG